MIRNQRRRRKTVPADSNSASTTFTIHALAGIETGLVKLAEIDGRIAAGRRDNVIVDYDNGAEPRSHQGLLYDCGGLFNRIDCDVYGTVLIDEPGTYEYTVTWDEAGVFGGEVVLTGGKIIVEPPGDFVIVSVGDSVASGEGSPQLPRDELLAFGLWNDIASNFNVDAPECHRSSFAGPVLAANRIAATNDVTFIHIACSGAKFNFIQGGDVVGDRFLFGEHNKIDTQLHWLREKYGRIDVLMLSGGANNVSGDGVNAGFGKIVELCLTDFDCSDNTDFENELGKSIAGLEPLYDKFATLIESGVGAGDRSRDCPPDAVVDDQGDSCAIPREMPAAAQVPSVVAITEYFDPTRQEDGEFPTNAESALCTAGTITEAEWRFLYNNMVVPLNLQVADAARRHGWTLVDGIAEAFRTHGYCASPGLGDAVGDSWVIKIPESLRTQGDQFGTAHPDRTGQQVYGDRLYEEIVRVNPPRTRATATTNGEPYIFGTWVNTDVEVTLMAYNPIQESGVSATNYSIGEPLCTNDTVEMGACTEYTMPFLVTESGRNLVSFFSLNNSGAPETGTEPVEVLIDREPPVMTCDPDPSEIWPPNKSMVPVTVAVTAVDEVSGPADFWLAGISDSYGAPDEAIVGFELGTADVDGEMLADRRGNLGARTYTLTYASSDHIGNTGTCDAIVVVPHDQRPK